MYIYWLTVIVSVCNLPNVHFAKLEMDMINEEIFTCDTKSHYVEKWRCKDKETKRENRSFTRYNRNMCYHDLTNAIRWRDKRRELPLSVVKRVMERWRIDICPTVTTDGLFLVSGIALNRIAGDWLYKIRKTFTNVGLKRIDKLKEFYIE